MKRLIALLLTIALCLSLAACGGGESASDTEPEETTEATEETQETEPTEDPDQLAYDEALALLEEGNYDEAKEIFDTLGVFSDALDMVKECDYRKAAALLEAGENRAAYDLYGTIAGYKDAAALQERCRFAIMKTGTTFVKNDILSYEMTFQYENGLLSSEITNYNKDHPDFSTDYWVLDRQFEYEEGYTTIHTYDQTGLLLNSEIQKFDEFGNKIRVTKIYPLYPSSNYTYVYSYDEDGHQTEWVSYSNATGEGDPNYRYCYRYDEHGNQVETTYYRYSYGSWSLNNTTTRHNVYDDNGMLMAYTTNKSDFVWEYTYDSHGNKLTQTQTDDSYTYMTTYTYDNNGNLVEEIYTSEVSGTQTLNSVTTHVYELVELFSVETGETEGEE